MKPLPMRLFLFPVLLAAAAGLVRAESLSPVRLGALTCEHLTNPIGLGIRQPRLSWQLQSGRPGEIQTAWQVQAAATLPALLAGRLDLWDSGKVVSDQSVLVPWGGRPLASRAGVFWRVRIWDQDGTPTAWSSPQWFELGLLDPAAEWKGEWITSGQPRYDVEAAPLADAAWINAGSTATQAAAVRHELALPADASVRSAQVDVAADGLITLWVNGEPTQQGSSSRTAPLRADIRAQLHPGRNIIAISSAPVRGAIRRDGRVAGRNAIVAHGTVVLEDGRRLAFDTDGSWKAAVAPAGDWQLPAFDAAGWPGATVIGRYADHPSEYLDDTIGPGRYLRKTFAIRGPVAQARLYATALGVYEASINGRRVGDDLLAPGWTDYTKRVMVQAYDVTTLLRPGRNTLGAVLGDGWYAGRLGWMGLAQYGPRPAFNAQLELTYADGSTEVVPTDGSWQAGAGEIVGSDEQWGEVLDARKAVAGWSAPAGDDAGWAPAMVEAHTVALVPQVGPPVRRLLELSPQKITRFGDKWIVDFGQNMVGHVRLNARGPAGTTITVRHGEMLNADGSLYTVNLRPALATDTFTLRGDPQGETFEPHFTFHGFRYVEVGGYPGGLSAGDVHGIVVGSDTPRTGTFSCSDPDLNRLYDNIVWSQRGNFLSVPTDCPQRDERMGWMGDAQVFAPTAARNADVAAFFAKWLVDVDDAQTERGDFANFSPRLAAPQPGWPVWADAGVIIPWTMYTSYGDAAFLRDHYAHMTAWVDYCERTAKNLILTGGVGDHLAPKFTPTDIVDTAYFAHSTHLVAEAARILGRAEDAAKYDRLFHAIVAAFDQAFVGPDGSISSTSRPFFRAPGAPPPQPGERFGNTQTAYLLALRFDLLPDALRPVVARRLAADVEQNGHLTTGFVGVGLICPTLTAIGRSDLAWRLLLTGTYPSWLFSVRNGATTIWERWDGWTPERGFEDPAMNSFNHYSLGSVGAWLYAGAAGIRLDDASPGYKRFTLQPQFTSRLTEVRATLDSPYGVIGSAWHTDGDRMIYEATVPANSSAVVTLPVPATEVRSSGDSPAPATGGPAEFTRELPAGTYQFSFPRRLLPGVD